MAKIWQETRSGFFRLGFDDWQKSVGNQCRFVDLDRWQTADSAWVENLAERRKGGKSKLKLAEEMLWESRRRGITPMYGLFDAWYSGESLLNLLNQFGWQYITGVKKNRLFNGVGIDQTFRHTYGRKTGGLKKIGHEVLIVKDGERYLLTNNLELTSAEVKRIYPMRQQIEEVFRLLKQEFGWGKCRANTVQAQKAHLHPGLYAFCLTQSKAEEKGQTIYAYKQDLSRQQIPTATQFLQCFTATA